MQNCPFKIGDTVIYQPTRRGFALDASGIPQYRLQPGKLYKVERIVKTVASDHINEYVVVEGYNAPGGGIYWTEFAPA